jgi:hypothetical protein
LNIFIDDDFIVFVIEGVKCHRGREKRTKGREENCICINERVKREKETDVRKYIQKQ